MNLGKVGIIFNGGGFLGAYSAGFMKSIWEAGIRPIHIQGVSVGALNASVFIENESPDEMMKMWLSIEKAKASSIFNWKDIGAAVAFRKSALYTTKGLSNIIEKIDIKKIICSPIELQIVTIDETIGKQQVVFSSHDEKFKNDPELFRKIIWASTAIPGVLPPVKIGDNLHSDGLCFCLEQMIETGCDTIFILLNDQAGEAIYWDQRLFLPKDFFYEQAIPLLMEKALRKRPDFEILEDDQSQNLQNQFLPPIIKKIALIGKQVESALASSVHGDDINFVPHRIIPVNTRTPISTLHPTSFEMGDVKASYEQGCDQASALLYKLKNNLLKRKKMEGL